MATLGTLCVYCGSSGQVDPRHLEAASELGRRAAERDVGIVFGGGRVGLMGRVADGALAADGRVVGIIPEHLMELEAGHPGVTELEVVGSMHLRKARMCQLSDAFCILPGGLGTLDETFEIITWRQLRLHDKPIVIVNVDDFWRPLLDLIGHQTDQGYLSYNNETLFQVVNEVAEVFESVESAPEPRFPLDASLL